MELAPFRNHDIDAAPPHRSVSSLSSSSSSVPPAPSTASRRLTRCMRRRRGAAWSSHRSNACSPYDADDYRYPQSVEDWIVAELGGVYGPYTGRWFASKSDTDIEHMVAHSEAHDSGLCAADLATRRRFATDPLNLTLAGPRVNRYEKVDRDAAEWLPAQNRC